MKNAFKIFAVLIVILICLCSCGAEYTATKELHGKDATADDFNYADYYTVSESGSNKVIVYNAINGYTLCREYTVEVNVGDKWISVPVYYAEVARDNIATSAKTYFASVDLSGSMKVKVTPYKKFKTCEVKPKSDIPSAETSDNTVEFCVDKPMQLSLEFDGNIGNNLQFFVNPVETDIPDPNDPDVIFLTPGIHGANNCSYVKKASNGVDTLTLTSGKTLYLAGGAVLNAVISVNNAKDVTIRGRGIVDLLYYNVRSGKKEDVLKKYNLTAYPAGVRLEHTENVKIEGITFRNALYYTIHGGSANKTTVDNIKLFSRCEFSDGLDFMTSSDVTIKNCYIRSNDDGIAIYATRWGFVGSAAHWNIDNCVFLTDCAHSVNIGTHGAEDGSRDEISDINFNDIDILDCYETGEFYWGALGFIVSDNNYVHDINFENIRMYKLSSSRPVSICIWNFSNGKQAGYRVENVKFKNITLYGKADDYQRSKLTGYDSNSIITGITFENFVVGGTKVTEANKETYFDIQKNVENVTFK